MYVRYQSYLPRYLSVHEVPLHRLQRIVNATLAHSLHTLNKRPKFVNTRIGNCADGQTILVHGVGDDELVGYVSILLPLSADDVENIVGGDGPELVGIESGPSGDVVMHR